MVFIACIVSADSGLVSVLINHIMVIAFIARVDHMGIARVDHMGSHFIPLTSHLITISEIGEEADYIEIS